MFHSVFQFTSLYLRLGKLQFHTLDSIFSRLQLLVLKSSTMELEFIVSDFTYINQSYLLRANGME